MNSVFVKKKNRHVGKENVKAESNVQDGKVIERGCKSRKVAFRK